MRNVFAVPSFMISTASPNGEDKDRAGASTEENSQSVFYRYLNEIDEDEYLAVLDNLLAVKRKSVHAENEYELNNKLVRFALSRGSK